MAPAELAGQSQWWVAVWLPTVLISPQSELAGSPSCEHHRGAWGPTPGDGQTSCHSDSSLISTRQTHLLPSQCERPGVYHRLWFFVWCLSKAGGL